MKKMILLALLIVSTQAQALDKASIKTNAIKVKESLIKHSPKIIALLSLISTGYLYFKQRSTAAYLKNKQQELADLQQAKTTSDLNTDIVQNHAKALEIKLQTIQPQLEDKERDLRIALEEIEDLKKTLQKQNLRLQADL